MFYVCVQENRYKHEFLAFDKVKLKWMQEDPPWTPSWVVEFTTLRGGPSLRVY